MPSEVEERESANESVDLTRNDINELLDKRSELMKRGRVKRVYYQVRDTISNADMRREFDDLEELE